ncbi:hypothetical protein JKY72_03830 [Candidatus Gracilibacteria bacterium]|nr:hypothetical protein [Candidatus Gracilibacteria bacterium]
MSAALEPLRDEEYEAIDAPELTFENCNNATGDEERDRPLAFFLRELCFEIKTGVDAVASELEGVDDAVRDMKSDLLGVIGILNILTTDLDEQDNRLNSHFVYEFFNEASGHFNLLREGVEGEIVAHVRSRFMYVLNAFIG